MPESHHKQARDERILAVRFRVRSWANEVVARLLEAARRTDIELFSVFGDGERVYPLEDREPELSALLWRAELLWRSSTSGDLGEHLEIFLGRAELFLNLPDGLRLELGGAQRKPRRELVG